MRHLALIPRVLFTQPGLDSAAQYAPGLMEGIANIVQRLGAIEDRLGVIDGRLGAVEGHLGAVEGGLGTVEGRLDTIEGRLDTIEGRLDTIQDNTLLNNAMTLNHRTIARNQMNQPHCEPLRKTVRFL